MDSSPPPQAISPPSLPSAGRDSSSPISDCIVVRDCDSSSVITMDTAITSIATTGETSKENSRAGSVPTQIDTTEDILSLSPRKAQIAVKLEAAVLETQEAQTLEVQPEIDPAADSESDIKHTDLEINSTPRQTRVLRPRPPPVQVVKTPRSIKKARQQRLQEEEQPKEPSPQLSDVIQIRDPVEIVKVKVEEGNRRRSSRLSILASTISMLTDNTQTPKRDVGKRSHEVMAAGSKSADAKLGSRSWGKAQNSTKKIKVKGERSDEDNGDDDSSEDDSGEADEDKKSKPQVTKRKKVWLTQGLFVGQEEDFDPRRRTKRGRLSGSGSVPKKAQAILPLPMFQGKTMMKGTRDFKLPFNIFSPTPYKVHPPGWKILSRNILVGDARDLWKSESEPTGKCTCIPETGCDENCLNRCVYYECNDENCNVGVEHCQNRQFAALKTRVAKKTKFAEGVEVIQTVDRGFGLRATRSFEPNQIIVEYCGEIISQEETETRMKKIYKNNSCYYLMLFDQSMIIDATRGSVARFVNHSCEPNCRMEKWIVDNKPRMALFAGENGVETGEELTYDYNFNWFSGVSQQVCRCGSSKCRGAMGKRTDGRKPPVEVKAAPTKLKRKINRTPAPVAVRSATKAKKAASTGKASRIFKVVKKTVVKKTINRKVVKKTMVKPRALNHAAPEVSKKPILLSSIRANASRGLRTYGSASRTIKVDETMTKDTLKLGSSTVSTASSAVHLSRRGPGRPKRGQYENLQALVSKVTEKTGLQGTVLDTIVVNG